MIYFQTLVIPMIATILIYFIYCLVKDKFRWKGAIGVIVVNLIVAGIGSLIIYYSEIIHKEIHNSTIKVKERKEVHCRHSYDCNCRMVMESYFDSDGNLDFRMVEKCDTCYEHRYDVWWLAKNHIGEKWYFESPSRQGLIMPKAWKKVKIGEPTSTINRYKDYRKAIKRTTYSSKVLVNEYKQWLPTYPNNIYNKYKLDRFMSYVELLNKKNWINKLSKINGQLGPIKQCNIILIIVPEIAEEYIKALENHWEGAAKNDIVIAISINEVHDIIWARSFSLDKNPNFKINLKQQLELSRHLHVDRTLNIIKKVVYEYYQRLSMKELEHLTSRIVPTTKSLIIITLISVIGCFVCIFADNDIYYRYRYD